MDANPIIPEPREEPPCRPHESALGFGLFLAVVAAVLLVAVWFTMRPL